MRKSIGPQLPRPRVQTDTIKIPHCLETKTADPDGIPTLGQHRLSLTRFVVQTLGGQCWHKVKYNVQRAPPPPTPLAKHVGAMLRQRSTLYVFAGPMLHHVGLINT